MLNCPVPNYLPSNCLLSNSPVPNCPVPNCPTIQHDDDLLKKALKEDSVVVTHSQVLRVVKLPARNLHDDGDDGDDDDDDEDGDDDNYDHGYDGYDGYNDYADEIVGR